MLRKYFIAVVLTLTPVITVAEELDPSEYHTRMLFGEKEDGSFDLKFTTNSGDLFVWLPNDKVLVFSKDEAAGIAKWITENVKEEQH